MELCWTIKMTGHSPPREECDEARLVASSREGDSSAFGELVRLHQRRVFRLVGRFFSNREDVEDVAQETFVTVWRKLGTYKAKAPFEHWLTRVCLNCCYARLRKRRPVEVPFEADVKAPDGDMNAHMEVEKLLRPLKPVDRFILLLLDGEGWSVREIAERLGWTTVNVKVRAHRARRKLRKMLEQDS